MKDSKTVLITGGAKRIGAALVKAFHQQGMDIVFQYYRSTEQAQALLQSLNQQRPDSAVGVCADLNIHAHYQLLCDTVDQHFGRLDVLINNASGFFPTPVDETNEEDWDQLMNVNARAPFFLSAFCKTMLSQQYGCIINITDIYADKPLYGYPVYCASKAALSSLTVSLAQSFAPEIRVNAIAPGAILAAENPGSGNSMTSLIEKTPLKRFGGEESIVETALFLATQASFITGQTISVDGGRSVMHN